MTRRTLVRRRGASRKVRRVAQRVSRDWRRWGTVLMLLATVMATGWAGRQLLDPNMLPIRHIPVYGTPTALSETELTTITADYLNRNFFSVDIDALYQRLLEQPWVEQVSIRRRWPDTLAITLVRRQPFGYWGQDELIDAHGIRFRPVPLPQNADLPRLAGPDGHEQQLIEQFRLASSRLATIGLKIARLVEDRRRSWQLTLDGGTELKLGRIDFERRLMRFVSNYRLLAARMADIDTVDLRYVNGFAVRWLEPAVGSKRKYRPHLEQASTAAG